MTKKIFLPVSRAFRRLAVLFTFGLVAHACAQDQAIYTNSLQNGWQSWSYNTTVNFSSTAYVYTGTAAIAATVTNNYGALWLQNSAFSTGPYTNLVFWLNGGAAGGQLLSLRGVTNNVSIGPGTNLPALAANTWQQFVIPLASVGLANQPNMTGFWLQSQTPTNNTFYVDDVSLTALPVVTNIALTVTVDAQANRHAISPLIYGTAFASSNQLADLNFTLNRWGGDSETRYNWQINAHNLAADWYFESYPDSSPVAGASADDFVSNSVIGGAQALMTIPMIGWMPKLGTNRTLIPSYSVAKYGAQTATDPYHSDAGNGISSATGQAITNNNPNDANFLTNTLFQQAFVQHLLGKWGTSTNGGLRYYIMDNEHSIWFSTHQDVHPVGPTMSEIYTDIVNYASMVKSNDPNALVLGPEEWGWSGYLYSGYDQWWAGKNNNYNPGAYPDRMANGGSDYMPWLLNEIYQHDLTTGIRSLDYFTLHCYPQEGSVSTSASDHVTQLLRNQSTRVFWDTNYLDPSWINNIVMLIPRMKNWATNYPGTKLGVTEYNWGAETNIGGATAQADILGIFGQQGLDLATRWAIPATNTPTYLAMKIFRNYDGSNSIFGDTSVSAVSGTNVDLVSAFAAARTSDGALTLVVINKQITATATMTLTLTNFLPAPPVQVWQITASNVIAHLPALNLTGTHLTNTLPAQSITLFIVPTGAPPNLAAGNVNTNVFDLWLNGQTGQRYALQISTNLISWQTLQTNSLTAPSQHLYFPTTNGQRSFYRAQWLP